MPKFEGKRERKEAHLFDAVKWPREGSVDFVPKQYGRLFVSPYDGEGAVTDRHNADQHPPSDVTFMLEEVQVEVRGSREEAKVLMDGVRFEIIVGESRWPVRGGEGEGEYGDRFLPRAHPSEVDKADGPIYIPARRYFAVAYELSDAAFAILATRKDTGLRFHLLGKFMRDVA